MDAVLELRETESREQDFVVVLVENVDVVVSGKGVHKSRRRITIGSTN